MHAIPNPQPFKHSIKVTEKRNIKCIKNPAFVPHIQLVESHSLANVCYHWRLLSKDTFVAAAGLQLLFEE